MPYTFDVLDEGVRRWSLTPDGVDCEVDTDYAPTVYAGVRDGNRDTLDWLRTVLEADPKVVSTGWERWFTDLRASERERVLRVDLERVDEVRTLVREVRTLHEADRYAPGTIELYNTDFSPQFRYCLETGIDPTPSAPLRTLHLDLSEKGLADRDLSQLRLAGERLPGDDRAVLEAVAERLDAVDPDVLVVSLAGLVPLLSDRAAALGLDDFRLGRLPGYRQLAGASEMQTYGQVLHSPARYHVPGRAVVNRSNSFLWAKAGLPGLLDLVERSWKPLQEAGWASIGNLLTAIQIREALARGVLVPGTKTQVEAFKSVETLHAADRGGFTFQPEVGLHEAVHELDFSSLYPNIMVVHNISPETVLCDCHPDREDVPVLGYNVCPERGFLADVLEPIVADRDAIKAALRGCDDDAERERLEARSAALKWVLVTCFGYQGYKNSKFGRIEAHEAINAHAREIMLVAKAAFERAGWRVVHGIVDSIWVVAAEGETQTDLEAVAAEVSDAVGIRLEYEHAYDWCCFVPRRESATGALTKYFGKLAGEDGYKVRGVEVRQRSTPAFVATAQRACMDALDRDRTPEAVADTCGRYLAELRAGGVDPADLVVKQRVSKPLEAYTQATLNVAALARYRAHGIDKRPGQDVRYVVVDDGARRTAERVRLSFEPVERYDADWYAREVLRAAESVVSPLGWDRRRLRRHLRGRRDVTLGAFG